MHAHCGPCDVTMPRCAAHSPSPCPACLQPGLLPVPAQLFQGSLLLGGIAKLGLTSGKCWLARSVGLLCCAVLLLVLCVLSCCWARPTGACPRAATDPPCHPCHPLPLSPRAEALSHSQVFVSPLLVGGWCGLVTTALNCLPVGNLDGGRVMLVSKQQLALSHCRFSSFFLPFLMSSCIQSMCLLYGDSAGWHVGCRQGGSAPCITCCAPYAYPLPTLFPPLRRSPPLGATAWRSAACCHTWVWAWGCWAPPWPCPLASTCSSASVPQVRARAAAEWCLGDGRWACAVVIRGQPLPAALPLAAACGTTWLLVSVPAPPPLRRLSPHQYRFRTACVPALQSSTSRTR